MNSRFPIALGLALCVTTLSGQVLDDRLVPKAPPQKTREATVPDLPATPAAPAEGEPLVAQRLIGLVIVKSKEGIKPEGMDNVVGVQVEDIPVVMGLNFDEVIAPYLGRPATLRTLQEIQRKIILFCREHDRPLVDVIVPNQEVKNGIVQMVLIEGRIGKVTVRNEGYKWFKDGVIRNSIRAGTGDVIREKELLADLNWVNRNPFRDVSLAFKQGAQPGLSDLQLAVEDRLPFRAYAGYEDTGSRITGEDRLLTGFNWGNAFGLGHELNYQYMTDPGFEFLTAHSGSYLMPLPWKHTLTLFGSHADLKADHDTTSLHQTGLDYQGSLRYSVPLPLLGNYQHEVSLGFDYKHSKNNLRYQNVVPITDTETDVNQFAVGYSSLLTDRWGRTSFGLQGYYSPGGLHGKNEDADFSASHAGAKAEYLYGRLNGERVTGLPWNCSWVLRGTGQWANGNLVPSEQLGVGGFNSVRGYDEREANGDRGLFLNNELRSMPVSLFRLAGKPKMADQLQFLAFCDYGVVENVDKLEGESSAHLLSVGGGLRYSLSRYLSVRFDYGVQLRDSGPAASDYGSRGHLGLIASF